MGANDNLQGLLQKVPVVGKLVRQKSSDTAVSSTPSHSSQLVDLVVEDHQAEDIERVRARKEGGPGWNSVEQKHFVILGANENGDDDEAEEEVRVGFNPDHPEEGLQDDGHTLTDPFAVGEESDDDDKLKPIQDRKGTDELGQEQPWQTRKLGEDDNSGKGKGKGKAKATSPVYEPERNVWDD